MNKKITPVLLAKFGTKEHIECFQSGKIYMNPISKFNRVEDSKGLRGDKLENMTDIVTPDSFEMKSLDGKITLTEKDLLGPIYIRNPKNDRDFISHIFCMSCIHKDTLVRDDKKIFDPRVKEFGDTVALILFNNISVFFDKIQNAFNKEEADPLFFGKTGLIKYLPEKINNSRYDAFTKLNTYAWQNEFRIAISNFQYEKEFILNVGDLSDICKVISIDDFKNNVKIDVNGVQWLEVV